MNAHTSAATIDILDQANTLRDLPGHYESTHAGGPGSDSCRIEPNPCSNVRRRSSSILPDPLDVTLMKYHCSRFRDRRHILIKRNSGIRRESRAPMMASSYRCFEDMDPCRPSIRNPGARQYSSVRRQRQ